MTGTMSRDEIILAHVDREGPGLEIGPSHAPIAPKKRGFRVHILDHLGREDLIEKYRPHGVNVNNIEEVDFVWKGETYAELVGGTRRYQWIIASHTIEHSPDLIGFINNCDAVLKEDGVLSLALPDMRYCFDHFRPLTGLARVIDAGFCPQKFHSAGMAAEFFLNVVNRGDQLAWDAAYREPFRLRHSLAEARRAVHDVREQAVYLDVHEWCFTPTSFRLIMRDLFELGFIQLKELAFYPTVGCEFFVTLSRRGALPAEPRLELMQRILQEQTEAVN